MDYQSIKKIILDKLQNELPTNLSYHSVAHVHDVIEATERIAASEKVSDKERLLLTTAALFHDTGFLFGAKDHEQKSCEIAQAYLPKFGYAQEDIDLIKGMIMATKIPQAPNTHLEQILADADLDYLGRDDFFKIGNKLYDELAMFGIINSERDWNLLQERFLEQHNYHTATALAMRSAKKEENLNIIKTKLKDS
jgi:uncharacterized protein